LGELFILKTYPEIAYASEFIKNHLNYQTKSGAKELRL